MWIFEYPYIVILILTICFVGIGIAFIYFAVRGMKAAKGAEVTDFSNMTKLENMFERIGKVRGNRIVTYISVDLDNASRLYSEAKALRILLDIKPILLKYFAEKDNGGIAVYGQKNFVALNRWNNTLAESNVNKCIKEVNQCLIKYNALNVVEVSVGSYMASTTQINFDTAINRAKQACTMAEENNTTYVEWNNSDGKSLEKRIKIENNIENEINNNKFFLEYQPVVDANTRSIVGAEVLARLNSEQEGIVTPGGFLGALSSVGLSEKFDYYVFEKNCKWISNNKEVRENYMYTINFSRTTLCNMDFTDKIIGMIEKYNLKYSTFAVEVLEDKEIPQDSKRKMIDNLLKLKEKGISILLDDFGRGYTSFEDLQELAVDTVKIDRTVLHNTNTDRGLIIFKSIVKTAKDLEMKVVCEGVETEEQAQIAKDAGCEMLQGYYFYRPMAVTNLEKLF